MPGTTMKFKLPDTLAPNDLIASLRLSFSMVGDSSATLARNYYDTFDWRLYQAGMVLWRETERRDRRLVLTDLEEEAVGESQPLKGKMPCFHQDFAPGGLRNRIAPLLEMRALIPRVDVNLTRQIYRILDEEEKTLLRLVIETHRTKSPDKKRFVPVGSWVRLLPVRGYQKTLERVQTFLTQETELDPSPTGVLEAALAAIGQAPADYTSKLDFHFSPEERAGTVAREIHLHLLDTIERNLPGTCSDLDSEFLHDLRVAVRRTRSALTQIKGVFSDEDLSRFKERLGWIGQITGPTRDMHVYLLGYEAYRDSLPERFRGDLEPLHRFLQAQQKRAHRAMVRKLRSGEFTILLADWRTFLTTPERNRPDTLAAGLPVAEVAGRRIFKIYKRVLNEGLAVTQESPPEALHELRKNCKKLRYLMEFFQSLYAKNEIQPLIKALKILLDNLGDYQDMEVQALKLRQFAHEMLREGEVPADTLLAMGMLMDGLLRRQQQARQAFAGRFTDFAGKRHRMAFRALFSQKKTDRPAA